MVKVFRKQNNEYNDSGFGSSATEQGRRLLNKDGSFNVEKRGLGYFERNSLFHYLVTISWLKFHLIIVAAFTSFNILFTVFYYFDRNQISGLNTSTEMDTIVDLFAFSVQTFTSVGYGRINPNGIFSNILASFESMIGLMAFAIGTGLLYGRFSRPVSSILYSHNALISPFHGATAFMLRLANKKKSQLINVEAELLLTLNVEENGKTTRKFYRLDLERKLINFLSLSWTIVHPINENSPLYGMNEQDLIKSDAEFIVLLHGFDDTFEQTVHSRHSYKPSEIVWGAKFDMMYEPTPDNKATQLHLDKINSYHKVELPVPVYN